MSNRRIDVLIAEHVLGWTEIDNKIDGQGMSGLAPGEEHRHSVPYYSGDTVMAIDVLSKLNQKGWLWKVAQGAVISKVNGHGPGRFYIKLDFNHPDPPLRPWPEECYHCSLPEAICRHVLRVFMVEVPA